MKKLFLLLVFLSMVSMGIAQEQHLTFKGVPIDGTMKECTAALIKAGLNVDSRENGMTFLTGEVAGYKGCIVGVVSAQDCDLVCSIGVLFPNRDQWTELENDYRQLKSMLTKKYGKPTRENEGFAVFVGNNINGMVMDAIREGQCEYYACYSTGLGDIELQIIEGMQPNTGLVRLTYFDKASADKAQNSAMDDL